LTPAEGTIVRSRLPAPVDPAGLVETFLRDAAADPRRTAIVDAGSNERLSRLEVADQSAAIAAGLRREGIQRGELVAVASPNAAVWPMVALGIWRAGGAVCMLSPFWGAEETARLLALASPRIAIAAPETAPMLHDAVSIAGLSAEVLVAANGPGSPPVPALGDDPRDPLVAAPIDDRDLAAVAFSSGIGGLFKGVRLTHGNLAASAAQVAASFTLDGGYDADSVSLAAAPFFASLGLGTALCAPLSVGAQIVTVPMPRTEPILAAAEAHRATHAVVPLTVIGEIAEAPSAPAHDLSSLRLLITGGARIPPALELRASERVGCPARDGYGMTEATSIIGGPQGRANDPDTVGWLAAGTEARVVDPVSQRDVEPEEPGEVWIRGPQVMEGYHRDPAATAATITPDGWLRTGDLGRFREDGQLVLEDRLKELIKVRGVHVAPAEVELVLCQHPSVRDAAVVGRPHPRHGEVPVAYVVPSADADPEQLIEFVAGRLTRHKHPQDVHIVERLPAGVSPARAVKDRARPDKGIGRTMPDHVHREDAGEGNQRR
jgi:acyl-CoA synthetase (AMP-forming)/AMP-acid ligase II